MIWQCYDIRQMTQEEYRHWYACMDSGRQRRTDRFVREDDRKRSVAADCLARRMIAQWCGVDEASIVFDQNQHGKPHAVGLAVAFNVSHSGDFVVCAVDSDPVGIDVERMRPVSIGLAEHVCTPEELDYVLGGETAIGDENAVRRFFEVWTAKEAWFKYLGTGITDLKGISMLPHILGGGCIHMDPYVLSIFPAANADG